MDHLSASLPTVMQPMARTSLMPKPQRPISVTTHILNTRHAHPKPSPTFANAQSAQSCCQVLPATFFSHNKAPFEEIFSGHDTVLAACQDTCAPPLQSICTPAPKHSLRHPPVSYKKTKQHASLSDTARFGRLTPATCPSLGRFCRAMPLVGLCVMTSSTHQSLATLSHRDRSMFQM